MSTPVSNQDTNNIQGLINSGITHLQNGQFQEANKVIEQMIERFPNAAPCYHFASEVYKAQNLLEEALSYISKANDLDPGRPEILFDTAFLHQRLRNLDKACKYARQTAKIKGANPNLIVGASDILSASGDHEGARDCLLPIVTSACTDIRLMLKLAQSHFYLGEMDQADVILQAILKIRPSFGDALILRSRVRTHSKDKNNISSLQSVLKTPQITWQDQMLTHFALSKEYDDIKDYDASFNHIDKACTLRRSHIEYDGSVECSNLQGLVDFYTAETLAAVPDGINDNGPIFIMGLPRSGTTLTERILTNGDAVGSINEASDFISIMTTMINESQAAHKNKDRSTLEASLHIDYKLLGEKYLESSTHGKGTSGLFIDKLPFNFLYCGLIKKALPNAKIIHVKRNPMDSCFAVYKTLFNQAYFFSYDQIELAEYYIAYNKLMKHWQNIMPDQILEVAYESLVQNPAETTKKVFEYCGLDYDPAVINVENNAAASSTASAAQIRQPIYTSSVEKWKHYEQHLAPLKNKLTEAGLVDQDGDAL